LRRQFAIVLPDQVRVSHRDPRIGMPEPLLTEFHGNVQLIEQGAVAVPEGMEAASRDSEPL